MRIVDYVLNSTNAFVESKSKEERKSYGQFFTSKEIAVFMADLFRIPRKQELHILDPGAGTGILSAALIERICESSKVKKISLTCYETDEEVVPVLDNNLSWIKDTIGIKLEYSILAENYIVSQGFEYNGMLGACPNPQKYDLVISNPPYLKIGKNEPETKYMPDICYGAPNLYFLFMGMSLFNLKDKGEMVYIVPRSWTSGAYFAKFRKKFLKEASIEHIHLFESRDKVFTQESVLQETMILKVRKSREKPKEIIVSTTADGSSFADISEIKVPYNIVVSGKDKYVYLVTNQDELEVLEKLSAFSNTLPDLGLRMKTGLTVNFRNRDHLVDDYEENSVPLFYPQHIKNGRVVFPIGREEEFVLTSQPGLLQDNSNYLFVKRFTAKEEPRRLQSAVYLASKYPELEMISTQNKINFIAGLSDLSECVVFGLYVIFNSTLYDQYYRILNGSTQVNSTEINSMPVPSIESIESMGNELLSARSMTVEACDEILGRYI